MWGRIPGPSFFGPKTFFPQGLRNVQWKAYRRSSGEELLWGCQKDEKRWWTIGWNQRLMSFWFMFNLGLTKVDANKNETSLGSNTTSLNGLRFFFLRCRVLRQIPMSGSHSCKVKGKILYAQMLWRGGHRFKKYTRPKKKLTCPPEKGVISKGGAVVFQPSIF